MFSAFLIYRMSHTTDNSNNSNTAHMQTQPQNSFHNEFSNFIEAASTWTLIELHGVVSFDKFLLSQIRFDYLARFGCRLCSEISPLHSETLNLVVQLPFRWKQKKWSYQKDLRKTKIFHPTTTHADPLFWHKRNIQSWISNLLMWKWLRCVSTQEKWKKGSTDVEILNTSHTCRGDENWRNRWRRSGRK